MCTGTTASPFVAQVTRRIEPGKQNHTDFLDNIACLFYDTTHRPSIVVLAVCLECTPDWVQMHAVLYVATPDNYEYCGPLTDEVFAELCLPHLIP